MWHHHRQDMASLNKQLHGYSVGLTAFYAALLRQRPGALLGLVKLLPLAAGYLKGGKTGRRRRRGGAPGASRPELDRRQLQGMLKGPLVYAKSRRVQRRAAATAASLVTRGSVTSTTMGYLPELPRMPTSIAYAAVEGRVDRPGR